MSGGTDDTFDTEILGGSIKRGIVNPNLIEERKNKNFDAEEAFVFLVGEDVRNQVKKMTELRKKYPQLESDFSYFEMNRQETMAEWWRRFKVMFDQEETADIILKNSEKKDFLFSWSYLFPGTSPMHLHQSMFTKSILYLGSEKQQEQYLKKADHWNIIGCYAQTELGHGSNVAGLETTATFDLATDEFVIHTPTIRASKFWPGSLGQHATHAIVFARCFSLDNDYGVQPFIIQIRDMDTHMPLKGIEVGDLGTKLGYNSVDNGYLKFTNFRVDRK